VEKKFQKLCFIGDMGDGSDTQKKVARDLKKENCHHIFVVGDVIYTNGIHSVEDPALKERFVDIYEPIAKSGNKPRFSVVLGNHDFQGKESAWLKVPRKFPWVIFPNYYYLQKMNGACFVGMDTDFYIFPWSHMALGQSSWLKKITDEMKDCQLKVLFAHHPYLGRENATGWIKSVFEKYVVGKYDYVITGHEHILRDMGKNDGTHFFISGAGGKHDEEEAGYLVMELEYRGENLRFARPRYHYTKIK
jgi:predicted phosphodiesterase